MFKKSRAILLALAALVMVSCGDVVSKLGGMKTDSPEVLEKAKELAKSNFDPTKWKVVSVDWSEDNGNDELTGNVASIRFYMIDNDGKAWQQSFHASLGWKASDLDDTSFAKGDKYDDPKDFPVLDLGKIDAAKYTKIIEDAKALIPKGYTYKSVDSFSANTFDKAPMELTLNVVEEGKETVTNAGRTSIVFYELNYTVDENGKVTLNE